MPNKYSSIDFSDLTAAQDDEQEFEIPQPLIPVPAVMEQAQSFDPTQYADLSRLSMETGMPISAVQTDPASVRAKTKYDAIDFTDLRDNSPVTNNFLSVFDNAVVAQNDIPTLQKIENLFTGAARSLSGVIDSTAKDFEMVRLGAQLYTADNTPTEKRGPFDMPKSLTEFMISIGGIRPPEPEEMAAQQAELVDGLLSQIKVVQDEQKQLTPEELNLAQQGLRAGAQSVMMNVPGIVAMAAGGGTGALLGIMSAQTSSMEYASARAEGLSPDEARLYATIQGVIEGTTEILPTTTLLKTLGIDEAGEQIIKELGGEGTNSIAKGVAKFMVQEMGTEQIATVLQSINSAAFELDKELNNATPEQIPGIMAERMAVTAIATVVGGGSQIGAVAAANRAIQYATERNKAQETQTQRDTNTLVNLNNLSENSDLRRTSPERFSQFVAENAKEGSDTVYIDGAQLSMYLTENQPQPGAKPDAALILLAEKAEEARQLGGDAAIPVQDFATIIAGTTHFEALLPSMTMTAEGIAPFRQQQESQEGQAYVRSLMSQAQENVSQYVEAQTIYETIKTQLIDTGMVSPANASVMAQIVPAWATVFAQKNGITVAEAYASSGLTIEGPMTGEMARLQGEQALLQARETGYQGESTGEALEWRQAVEKFGEAGMTPEARMARAQEMGFDTTQPVYHGTAEDFTEFDPDRAIGTQFWSTTDKAAVEAGEVGAQGKGVVKELFHNIKNPAGWAEYDKFSIGELVGQGYDGVALPDDNGQITYIAFKPNQYRSINAAFDPDFKESANLLAQDSVAPAASSTQKFTTRTLGQLLDQMVIDRHGERLTEQDAKTKSIIAASIVSEILDEMSGNSAAATWYKDSIAAAMSHAADLHPELDVDPIAAQMFRVMMAITSNGSTVAENVLNSESVYAEYKKTGKIPVRGFGKEAGAMKKGFNQLNQMIEKLGIEKAIDFLNTQYTVKQLKDAGFTISGELVSAVVPGSVIFGPKIGAFFQNLNGNFDYITMDRWFMRSWARYTGTNIPERNQSFDDRLARLRAALPLRVPGYKKADLLKNDDVLIDYAQTLHNKYAQDGYKGRSELNNAAKGLITGGLDPRVAPRNGAERQWIREVMTHAQEILAEKGKEVDFATMQALLWYREKNIFSDFGITNKRSEPTDYEQEFRKLVDARLGRTAPDVGAGRPTTRARPAGSLRAELERSATPYRLEQKAGPSARGYYDPANAVIRLTEAADLSTFLHEFAHFMYEMELKVGGKTRDDIHAWFKRNAEAVAAEANGYLNNQSPVLNKLAPGIQTPTAAVFRANLLAAKAANPNGASVWVGEESDYKDMRRFTIDGGRAGFAIEPNGNITGVFKHPDSSIQGAMGTLIPMAIKLGGTQLDAFEGFLTESYKKHGFVEVRRVAWNEEFRPAGWKDEQGTPDVVYMELSQEKKDEVARSAEARELQNTVGVRTGRGVLEQSSRKTLEPTREEDGSLRGLPRNVGRFVAKHSKRVAKVAADYMAARGLAYAPPNTYASVDPERATRIAQAYEAMKHDPQNPEVMAAYEAMIEETIAQYQAALDAGLRVDFIDFEKQGDPYEESPRMVTDDINDNNHMWVFSTRDGFGSDDTFDPVDNPLLRETQFMISGQVALVNDLFRVVHDYFGHVKEGVGFRASGEENAWRAHSAMYSPLARRAMTSETRGQNSWVNYGPHGEKNRTASSGETVFADQKVGLLPEWVVTEGAGDTGVYLQADDAPGEFEGSVTKEDVATYFDTGTTGDANKDSALRRAGHEQFARGFEAYLMEGKAPSVEMRNVFRTFVRWLTRIYNSMKKGLNVKLDDEMRQVFDAMIATEEQIADAKSRAKIQPLFTDAAMAGMTEEQFAEYNARLDTSEDVALETLRDKLIKQITRQTEAWWKEEKADLADEEFIKLMGSPVYVATEALRNGDVKLDLATVKEMVGETTTDKRGIVSTRPPRKLNGMTVPGGTGVHPDVAAAMFGYSSGSELLAALQAAEPIRKAADAAAQERMIEKHGDTLNDGTIQAEADSAIQNEERAKLLFEELKIIGKSTRIPSIDREMIRLMAEENIAKLNYRQIQPGKYRKAEIRAAQEAAVAVAKGDMQAAAQAKIRQVMNFYLGKAAQEARDGILKISDNMNRYNSKTVRENIMKAENGYWEQIVKILQRFEFRKAASLKSVDKVNEAIGVWAAKRIDEDGDALMLSDAVLNETYINHWKNIPYATLQGIADSVKNIEHVARYSNKITGLEEEIEFKQLVNKWVASMNDKVKSVFKTQRTTVAEGRNWGRWAMAQMTKIPFMASWLDGGDRVGLSHDILVRPFNKALNDEYKLWAEVGNPVLEAIQSRSREDIKRHNRLIFIPELKDAENDGNLIGHQVLAVALNVGNAGNLRKMLLGEGWANPENESEISIDNPKLQAVLKHMTASDWRLVQMIWDQMNKLYPQLAEVHRKTTGLTPPKVEAVPFKVRVGNQEIELQGGYYPVKYDPARSQKADENEQRQNAQVESMFSSSSGSIQASVTASATSERTKYYAPIRLSLDVVPNHFQETIHFITHHDAVRQVNKLIRNPEVAKAIKEKLGPEEYAQLRPWLNDIAKDGREAPNKTFIDSIFGRLRFGVTLGVMGFKASTGIIQISGLSNTVAEVGLATVYKSMRQILGKPKNMADAWDFAMANSKVLEHRTKTMDREMRAALEQIEGKRGFMAAVQETSMKHIAYIQLYMVDLPSWYAGYIKEMERSGDEQKAYEYGDWIVTQVQGSGATKDMAGLLRNQTKAHRLFTMFMTFFSALWNMERDTVRGGVGGKYSTTTVAAKAMFLLTIPVLFEMFMRGELGAPDEDDEDERLQKILTTLALFPVQSIPVVREFASGAIGEYGYNISPVASVLEQGIQALPEIATRPFTDEEITQGQLKAGSKVVGAFLGIPGLNQVWASGEHLQAVMVEGEEFTVRELLFGPKRE